MRRLKKLLDFILLSDTIQTSKHNTQENEMSKWTVWANSGVFGPYEANDEQGARDACARDAGYESEEQMAETLEQPSELQAKEYDPEDFE